MIKKKISYYLRWIVIAALTGVLCGLASAVFLFMLDGVTEVRLTHPWLVYLLPLGGLLVGGLYQWVGRPVEGGNNLILEEIHRPSAVIPLRMTPLVLVGTLLTHLFGGSAGREGTAVQMGGSIADQLTHVFKFSSEERRVLLMAGMSGGFGSVFGVPFAGMIFGIEVLSVGRLQVWALVECGVAAVVAHFVTLALGIHHTNYLAPLVPQLTTIHILSAAGAGVVFGLVARLFVRTSEGISRYAKAWIRHSPVRTFVGGTVIALLYFTFPILTRYAGLGVPLLVESQQAPLPPFDWLGKLLMTALTLGTGFKGGEVTPLLFVGGTLGNVLASLLPLPLPLLSSLGLVAVFAGAANTPLACTLMAMELFAPGIFVYAAIACFVSYAVSGGRGIYHSQRHPTALHAGAWFKSYHVTHRRPPVRGG